MGVPILKIPFVALKILLDYMNNVELVTVSLVSRRANWFLKACEKKNVSFFNLEHSEIRGLCRFRILQLFLLQSRKQGELPKWDFEIRCSVGSNFSPDILQISCDTFFVVIYFDNLKNFKKVEVIQRNLKIGEFFVPVVIVPNGIHAFWEDETNGLIQILSYLKTNLNLSIEHLNVPGRDAGVTERVVKHISSTQTVVKNLLVERYARLPDENFEFVLKNVSATETFSSYLSVSRNFKFDGRIRAKRILIWNGLWFTIQSLLRSTESEVIHVNGSDYTKEELRTFLSEWKTGRFPNLKKLHVNTKVNVLDVIDGFERREDKCENRGWWIVAIKGNGRSYGIFDPAETKFGDFKMIIHSN
ncbi:unnamed protein product [Caenorhabditis brenneri]